MTQKVLIAGASGRFGRHCKAAFDAAGWEVTCYDRQAGDLSAAAMGVDVIVNALNPPDYKNWDVEIPRITRAVIKAAKLSGATVLLPGNIYNFGDQSGPWSQNTPQIARSRKGQIRIEMEAAYRDSGVATILLRAGDFFGGEAVGTWLDLVMLKSLAKGKFVYPGDPDVLHAWGYLPDMARAGVALAEKRAGLERFCDIPFPGHAVSGRDMMRALERVLGRPLTLDQLGWWPIRLASPFWALGRELLEMRYLWEHPHALDGTKFATILPDFKATDFEAALASALPIDVNPDKAVIRAEALA